MNMNWSLPCTERFQYRSRLVFKQASVNVKTSACMLSKKNSNLWWTRRKITSQFDMTQTLCSICGALLRISESTLKHYSLKRYLRRHWTSICNKYCQKCPTTHNKVTQSLVFSLSTWTHIYLMYICTNIYIRFTSVFYLRAAETHMHCITL